MLYKPAIDVVPFGHAYAPGRPEPEVNVSQRVGPVHRVLIVFGTPVEVPQSFTRQWTCFG